MRERFNVAAVCAFMAGWGYWWGSIGWSLADALWFGLGTGLAVLAILVVASPPTTEAP